MRMILAAFVLCSLGTTPLQAEKLEKPTGDPSILPEGATLEELWNEGEFTEGVAVAPDGTIYFSDIVAEESNVGRILKYDPQTGETTVYARNSLQSNGLMFDAKGRLIAACGANHGARALCEITKEGKVRILVDEFQGKKLNAPNDLVIHQKGWIYFSDPRYVGEEPVELDHMSVYRYDPKTGKLTRVTTEIEKPNGVMLSPYCKILYVAETNNGSLNIPKQPPETKPGRMTLNAFPVLENGDLGKKWVLVDFGEGPGIDGMTVDIFGNIYAAVRSAERFGIRVYSPEGKELAYIPTPELPTNCCFGNGEGQTVLYITAGTGLYRIQMKKPGYHPPVTQLPE